MLENENFLQFLGFVFSDYCENIGLIFDPKFGLGIFLIYSSSVRSWQRQHVMNASLELLTEIEVENGACSDFIVAVI